ncbi:uncharacterized protein LOC111639267 [Centruroides sculpturatus]|uniref:uncharacterized protein LOC111639267 n=1 Tax=Centruroides sculpturatus TaxID=218467 RepID=UPI000C6DC907|nr:uncharacterized protein LOC111639267 [Centruroides sculpturatus]XP_023240867.1 uncharacterized protein LOC111639267 [Centruroides sculpturatus]
MEAVPEEYEKFRPRIFPQYIKDTIDRHFPLMDWTDDDVILDIGCGQGKSTKQILLPKCPKIKKIVAIDIVPNLLNYARSNYHDDKIEYKEQNIVDRIETEDIAKYDKIFSSYALNYIGDYNKLFGNISQVLKPGGYFCILIAAKAPVYSTLRDLAKHRDWRLYIKPEEVLATIPPTHDWEDVGNDFRQFVSKFGLNAIESNYEIVDVPFTCREHFMRMMEVVCPKQLFEGLSPEVRKRLWTQSENHFFKYGVRETEDEVIWPVGLLAACGQKRYS